MVDDDWVRLIAPTVRGFAATWPGMDRRHGPSLRRRMPICWPDSPPSTGRPVRRGPLAQTSIRRRPRRGGDRTRSAAVLQRWGYPLQANRSRCLHVAAAQPQPVAEDLTSRALDSLRSDPAIERHFHGRHLHGVHRASGRARSHRSATDTAIRGRTRPDHGHRPGLGARGRTLARHLDGRPRRSATPTASCLAKIGPMARGRTPRHHRAGHWTRQTCTAWIAAVDRMRVGDHIQSNTWRTAAAISWESRCRRRRKHLHLASPAPSSATCRTGTGSRAGSTPHEHWKLRAASGHCRDPIRG